jgi:hypothetical protein
VALKDREAVENEHREARELVSWNDPSGVTAHNAGCSPRPAMASIRTRLRHRSQGSPGMPPRSGARHHGFVQVPLAACGWALVVCQADSLLSARPRGDEVDPTHLDSH